MIFEQQVCGA